MHFNDIVYWRGCNRVLLLNNLMIFLLAETMAGNLKEEIKMENIEIKEETEKDIHPSSTPKDTCTVYVKEEVIKLENTGIQGKFSKKCKLHFSRWIKELETNIKLNLLFQ